MQSLQDLQKSFLQLAPEEQEAFLESLRQAGFGFEPIRHPTSTSLGPQEAHQLAERRFKNGTFCPFCGSVHVIRHGRQADGTQRYRCKDCGKTFQASSNTVLRQFDPTRLAKLRRFVHCMLLEISLRKCARECEISTLTAFTWRHKILDALAGMLESAVLQGIVEYDETFLKLSFKGHRKMDSLAKDGIPLPSHHRGGAYVRRGLGRREVCVPIAVSRTGGFVGKISNLGTPSGQDALNVMEGRIAEGATLCTDGGRPGKKLAQQAHLQQVVIKGGRHAKDGLSIQTVNAFHSGLKGFVNVKFKGVATKYLNNYVVWYGFIHAKKADADELEKLLFNVAITAVCKTTNRDLHTRNAVPILSEKQQTLLQDLLLTLAMAEYEDRLDAIQRKDWQKQEQGAPSDFGDLPF